MKLKKYDSVQNLIKTVPHSKTFNKIYFDMDNKVHTISYNAIVTPTYIFVWSYVHNEIYYGYL